MTEYHTALASRAASADGPPPASQLLWCYAIAVLAMLPTQIFRLYQTEALPWLLADYAGRVLAISVILLHGAGQWCFRRQDRLRVDPLEAFLWIAGLVLLFTATPLDRVFAGILPETALGAYPRPGGWLYLFDLTFGIALVALHEELVFRRLGYHALRSVIASEVGIAIASALFFAAYHWWTGIGNMILVATYGLVAMPCYRRTGTLWPIGIAHYLLDVIFLA